MTSGTGGPARPSLKDVAARAGVSFQTTSKVLRGGGRVADATRERILTAAHELGYVANDVARSLVTQRTRTIGVVVGDLGDHVLARFVVGAEREARAHDHALVVVRIESGDGQAGGSLRSLLERRVDGILSFAPQLEDDPRLGEVMRTQLAGVSIHAVDGGGVSLVGSDQTEVARLATAHLVEVHGHATVGAVTGPRTRRVTGLRAAGHAAALRAGGIDADPELVEESDWTPGGGYRAATALLGRRPDVSALFVHNDTMAVGVLHAAADLGRLVPDDLAVVACDDVPVAAHTTPPLTTVRLPFDEAGAAAVRMLLDHLETPPTTPPRQLLPVELVVRRSCGCDGRPDDRGRARSRDEETS